MIQFRVHYSGTTSKLINEQGSIEIEAPNSATATERATKQLKDEYVFFKIRKVKVMKESSPV